MNERCAREEWEKMKAKKGGWWDDRTAREEEKERMASEAAGIAFARGEQEHVLDAELVMEELALATKGGLLGVAAEVSGAERIRVLLSNEAMRMAPPDAPSRKKARI